MPNPLPVSAPAGFVPLAAIGFTQADSTLSPVSSATPLPVTFQGAVRPAPLSGTATGTATVGPFTMAPSSPVILSLSGNWSGTVRLTRAGESGALALPLTAAGLPWGTFTANCCEAVWEDSAPAAELYLNVVIASGTLNYRVEQ